MQFLKKWGLIAAAAALMVFAACEIPTISAAAYTGTPGLVYELIESGENAGTYRVRWQGVGIPEEIWIPATHRADDDSPWLPVTEIGAAGDGAGNTGAFAHTVIKEVHLPEGIKVINDSAFTSCAALASVTIPASVTFIGPNAFSDCYSLVFTFAKGANLQTIGNSAFYNCRANTSITIPASVTYIGSGAFGGDSPDPGGGKAMQLASVTFEEGIQLESIGGFSYCGKLTSITIPDGVKTIGGFSNSGLTSITIPASVTSISSRAFSYCASLRTITFEKGSQLQIINSSVFDRAGITTIEIPASVTTIDRQAFYWARSLRTVTFEKGSQLESIGYMAFEECLALTSIEIPANLKTMDSSAFYDCMALENITFEEGSQLESIGAGAFEYCCRLAKITIPASVMSIGARAFFADSYGQPMTLASVTFEKGSRLESIGDSAFYGCSEITEIIIPASVTSIGNQAFCRDSTRAPMELARVIFEYGSRLQSIGAQTFLYCNNINNITIPAGVTAVGNGAFGNWTSAQTIIIAGKGSQTTADGTWGAAWRDNCGAAIFYQ